MSEESFKYRRDAYVRPKTQLIHVDLSLNFFDDRVEGEEFLSLCATESINKVVLDAQGLDILETSLVGEKDDDLVSLTSLYIKEKNKLEIFLPKEVSEGVMFILKIKAVCTPTQNILDGLYYDVAPEGAPPQFMSQCQQWGFQRIMPIIDDCTSKCTWCTTIEASSRYTQLISNGDISKETNPNGVPELVVGNPDRQRITYVNSIPMPPYLFVVAVGTWDVLRDFVKTPYGRTIQLEYLVPPGSLDGAKIPMEILKDSVLWQCRRLAYDYKRDCYRTICMEKSNFGGMENVGNTTIITEAALVNEWTIDRRLEYAHAVIVHEFEHNHCGSDVTMETPFDMWLNEAYTVNIEREYMQSVFGESSMRLKEINSMREPLSGPLACEASGKEGRIVRDGFNNPDEVVDGTTYVKAPEVLGMLESIMGHDLYSRGTKNYFSIYNGANANTNNFIKCMQDVFPEDLSPFFNEWLFTIGYPEVEGEWIYDDEKHAVNVVLSQKRKGADGNSFVIPFTIRVCDINGEIIVAKDVVLTKNREEFLIDKVYSVPSFIDWNYGKPFYGVFKEKSPKRDSYIVEVLNSKNDVGRVEAMRFLTDIEMERLILNPEDYPSKDWLDLFPLLLSDDTIPEGIKASLLNISENMVSLDYLAAPDLRNKAAATLRKCVAEHCGFDSLKSLMEKLKPDTDETYPVAPLLPILIPRRELRSSVATLIASLQTEYAGEYIEELFLKATNITDKISLVRAYGTIECLSKNNALIIQLADICKKNIAAYGPYLSVVASTPSEKVFDLIAREEQSSSFDMSHPAHSRSLYSGFASNNAMLWTEKGLKFVENVICRLASLNEYSALRVLSAFQSVGSMREDLRTRVVEMLRSLKTNISKDKSPSVFGKLEQYLSTVEDVSHE